MNRDGDDLLRDESEEFDGVGMGGEGCEEWKSEYEIMDIMVMRKKGDEIMIWSEMCLEGWCIDISYK